MSKLSVVNNVSEYLRTNIENGSWRVGQKIPSENELTRTLGVSRSSVRVAIQQFVIVGALQSEHGRGTFVKRGELNNFSYNENAITHEDCQDMRKVIEFRLIIEPEGCYLATMKRPSYLIGNLAAHMQNMLDSVGDTESFVREDISFHECIAKASGNQLIEKCLLEVFSETTKMHAKMNKVLGFKDGIYYHSVILNTIKKGDAKLARRQMREHLQQTFDLLGTGKDTDNTTVLR